MAALGNGGIVDSSSSSTGCVGIADGSGSGDGGSGSGGSVGGLYITDGASECQGQAVHFFALACVHTCVYVRPGGLRVGRFLSTASVRIIHGVSAARASPPVSRIFLSCTASQRNLKCLLIKRSNDRNSPFLNCTRNLKQT